MRWESTRSQDAVSPWQAKQFNDSYFNSSDLCDTENRTTCLRARRYYDTCPLPLIHLIRLKRTSKRDLDLHHYRISIFVLRTYYVRQRKLAGQGED